MIVSKTPLRVSLIGGGTDIPSFYQKNRFGCVLSSSIDKYIYVTIKKQSEVFFEKFRLNYSETEIVNNKNKIKNPIIREVLKFMNINDNIYISTIADIPASSGLGSSSSFCVGLLHALHIFKKEKVSNRQLAEEASHIEIDLLKKPIGKQDQYASSFGGFNYIQFNDDNTVNVKKLTISKKNMQILSKNSFLFWSGISRSADKILMSQNKNSRKNLEKLMNIRNLTIDLKKNIELNIIDLKNIGELIKSSWQDKKLMSNLISNSRIDKAIKISESFGSYGGKLLGAGGGGFIYLLFNKKNINKLETKLKKINFINCNFNFETSGSTVNIIE